MLKQLQGEAKFSVFQLYKCPTNVGMALWNNDLCFSRDWCDGQHLPHVGQVYTNMLAKCLDSTWFLTLALALCENFEHKVQK